MAEIVDQVYDMLKEKGYTIADFMQALGAVNTSLLNMSSDTQKMFNKYYDMLISGVCGKKEKGKVLENLTATLFDADCFCVCRNCRTSTNEVDLMVEWSEKSRMSCLNSAYPYLGERILCECKNYNKPVDVTYVGKFASLMAVSRSNVGIMVSWEGVTGERWNYGCGLIKKYALAEKREIIVVDKYDLEKIRHGKENILSIIHKKHIALTTDIDYQKYIRHHEAESQLG